MTRSRYADGSVAARVLAGDRDTLGLVMHWIATVLTAHRFHRMQRDAKDLLQESLLQVIESLRQGRFDDTRDLRPYVQAIAYRVARRAEEKLGRAPRARESELSTLEDDFGRWMETRQIVRSAFDLLDARCRSLIRAFYLDGRTYAELATETGVPVGTVKSRLFRCLETLRRGLRERHDDWSGPRSAS